MCGWWITPELYLRRPYRDHLDSRFDMMLRKAAERGVKINIIVYYEPSQLIYNDS